VTLEDVATLEAASRPAPRGVSAVARLVRLAPWPIVVVTAIAAALRFASLAQVAPNDFYDAAVRSMSLSWRNFFFGAFDPGGLLSVDKPPLDLWLQVISVKLLGWHEFSLKLPEALGGTLSVPLLYDLVRRVADRPAAIAAATVLALAPASVVTARSDTMDSVMMLLILAAAWLTVRACQRGERRWLVAAGVALGLAFNVKLLECLLCLPSLVLLYGLAAPRPVGRRLADLGLAGAALVVSGLAWAVAVSVAPGDHPWPVGSTDGTVWSAMFVFNGLGKVSGTPDRRPGGPGPLRLMVSTGWHYDELFGCVLLAALVIAGAALAAAWWSGRSSRSTRVRPAAGADRLRRAFVLATLVWVVFGVIVFDTMGTVHVRYLEALSPALAIAIGLGSAALAGLFPGRGRPSVGLTALALAGVCAYSFHFHVASASWGAVALLVAAVGAGLLASAGGRALGVGRWLVAGLIVACALSYPVHETLALTRSDANDSLGLAVVSPHNAQDLAAYLEPRTAGVRYELAVDEPLSVAPLIIRDARPILPLTSWGGRRLVSLATLLTQVRRGAVSYGLVSDYSCGVGHRTWAACTPASLWIRRHGVNVTREAGLTGRLRLYRLTPAQASASE